MIRRTAKTASVAVVSSIVTTVVLAGGLAFAQSGAMESVANNSVNSAKIVDNSIRSIDIKDGTVAFADLNPTLGGQLADAPVDVNVRITQAAGIAGHVEGLFGDDCDSLSPNSLPCNQAIPWGTPVELAWVNTGVPAVLSWGDAGAGCTSSTTCTLLITSDSTITLAVTAA